MSTDRRSNVQTNGKTLHLPLITRLPLFILTLMLKISTLILKNLGNAYKTQVRSLATATPSSTAQPVIQEKKPKMRTFNIYRYNPDTPDIKPKLQAYTFDAAKCGPMGNNLFLFTMNETMTLTFHNSSTIL